MIWFWAWTAWKISEVTNPHFHITNDTVLQIPDSKGGGVGSFGFPSHAWALVYECLCAKQTVVDWNIMITIHYIYTKNARARVYFQCRNMSCDALVSFQILSIKHHNSSCSRSLNNGLNTAFLIMCAWISQNVSLFV